MSPVNGFVIISLLITLVYFGGLISFLTDHEAEKCEMTYMFEYPQFVRISNKIDDQYPKYGLYAYSEGRLTERARNMLFDGIPVLFLPGSGGSHKQVRSLASIALRKSLNSHTSYHFDYFTIDYNNELSGLNGGVLADQLDYANHSVYRVLELYKKQKRPPTSVILIGHSMGGILAKALLRDLPEDSTLVPLVIALSSPLVRPVVTLDYYLHKFYKDYGTNFSAPPYTTFVSIAGGYNDFLVPTYFTKNGHLTLTTSGVPKCWVSTNHVSILWCKQLILAINRALFESVDPQTKQISTFPEHRLEVFRHHLVRHSGIKIQQRDRYNYPFTFNVHGTWHESINRQYSIRLPKGTVDPKWYMLSLIVQPKHDAITVVALNMEPNDWVFICPAISMKGSQRVCDIGRHLTHTTEISPSHKYKRRTFRIDMYEAKNNYTTATHAIVRVLPTNEPVVLHMDVHSSKERTLILNDLPKWFTYKKYPVIEQTEEKAIQYQLVLPQLTQVIQMYVLYLEPTECSGITSHATISLLVPWDNHEIHGVITETEKQPTNLRLYSPRPPNKSNESAIVRLTLDPTCRYKVSIKNTIHFGNMARFYSPLLVANIAAVTLMTLRSQLLNIAEKERCSMFFTALKEGAKPYYIITAVKVLSRMLSFRTDKFIPSSDWKILTEENLDFLLLPLLLYVISVGVVWLLAATLSISFIFFESTVHKLALKFLSRTVSGTSSWTNHLVKTFEKLPGAVALFLIATSISTSGGLAICLATVFYFMKLTQMAQDFIEDIVKGVFKSIGNKLKEKLVIKIKEKWKKMRQSKRKPLQNETAETVLADVHKTTEDSQEATQSVERSNEPSCSTDTTRDYPDEILLEKPMEFKLCAKDDPTKVQKVDGKKLLELLQNDHTNLADADELAKEVEPETIFGHITFDWLKEIMENDEIFFHFTIFVLYLIVACLNIPSVLTWAHNFRYNKHLQPDPALIPGVLLSACALPLWQFEFPKVEKQFYREISHVVYGTAVLCLLYGIVSIYRLSFIISGVVVLLTLHQLFAIKKPEGEPITDAPEDTEDTYGSKVKAKWE